MKTLDPKDLAAWLADPQRPPPLLLDVREPWEYEICHLQGAQLMPMQTVPSQAQTLDAEQPIVCICHHGARSAQVALFLERDGHANIYNLTGGIDAWAKQVDSTMSTY